MLIFLVQGLVIGTIGTVVGAGLGAGLSNLLDTYRVISIPGDVYQVTYLPFRVLPRDLITIVIGGIVICFFATLYPSRQAAKLDGARFYRLIGQLPQRDAHVSSTRRAESERLATRWHGELGPAQQQSSERNLFERPCHRQRPSARPG